MPAKDYASSRYSRLDRITRANATRLRPVWTFSTGVLGGHQGQPLVVRNTMYVVTPWPNVLYAFDLTQEGYPLKWKYRPDVSPNAIGESCCDVINRGAFYADGKIVYNLLDGHTVAVDAASGKELWKTRIADLGEGETTPMAPLVVKDRVIVGAFGRRVRHLRLGEGARPRDRQGRLDRAEHRPRRRDAGPARHLQAVLRQGRPSWAQAELAGQRIQDRRRAGLGLDVLRSRARPGLLRRRAIPRPTTPSSGRATTSGPGACWRGAPATARWSGPTSSPRTTTGTTTPSPR